MRRLMEENVNTENHKEKKRPSGSGGAAFVALGILLSRIMGLVRQKIFAYYFGNSDMGDAFYAALKIPNFPQNLLGDGVLSASFIPVYSKLLAEGKHKEADQVAGIIGALLTVLNALIVVVGILVTPLLIDLIAPGFEGEKRELTIRLVQIFFPGVGLLVMSAWCLGVLNSHRRFFLSYVAPVIWNVAIIATLIGFGSRVDQGTLVIYTAFGVLVGSALQFLVQIPAVIRLAPHLRWSLSFQNSHVRQVFKSFGPVVTSRGVVQLSAYVDNILASLLPSGAVSAIAYAQSLYMLPISLFGMSVSAAELPVMSGAVGSQEEIAAHLRKRVGAGMKQIAFFVIPSIIGFWAVGDVIVRALYLGGAFDEAGVVYVWAVLVGYTVGLLAGTLGRLFSSAFYSLKDTRNPLKFAILRVLLATGLGTVAGLYLPGWLGIHPSWGTAGLTAAAGFAGWVEFWFLRRKLFSLVGEIHFPRWFLVKVWSAALVAGAFAWFVKIQMAGQSSLMVLLAVLTGFGLIYLPATLLFGIEEARGLIRRVRRT
jgi:putative peptidoglycan lipid II flippase